MNTKDVLMYGHLTVLHTLERVPPATWDQPGVCGIWSVRQIVAHLASFEQLLVDILAGLLDGDATPTLDRLLAGGPAAFNDDEVARRQALSAADTLAEYQASHDRVMSLMDRVPADSLRQNGILAWYGATYDLEDYLVYSFYGHKREHMAEVNVFRDRLAAAG